jgi:hypothetical protein
MTVLTIFRRLGLIALLAGAFALSPADFTRADVPPYDPNEKPGPPPPVPLDDDRDAPQVQGRGPIHEGFAQPNEGPYVAPVAPKTPPEPILEQPPDQRPEGDNVVWVPGYWAWDEDKSDFLWVSGFWRVAPNGRRWVPGYWTKTDAGWQWVNGFWAPSGQEQIPYVQEPPPASLERGPSVPPPSDDYYYVPGSWVYPGQYGGFAWSPGFWVRPQPGYLWNPARWAWTPRGYLYVSGYWDRNFANRGVLFAPTYFARPSVWQNRGWAYTPSYVVSPQALMGSLWVRPRAGYYAYGDYYASQYAKAGYQPWATYGAKARDPLYGYYRWASRDNRNWQRNLVTTYQNRVNGDATLPPRTLVAQTQLQARQKNVSSDLIVAQRISQFKSSDVRLTKTTQTERTVQQRFVKSVQESSVQRRTAEARPLKRSEKPAPLALNKVAVSAPRVTTPPKSSQQAPRVQTPAPQQKQAPAPQPKQRQEAPRIQTPSQPKQPQPQQRHEVQRNHQPTPHVQTPQPRPQPAPQPRQQQQAPRVYQSTPHVQTPQPRQPAPQYHAPAPQYHAPAPQMRPAPHYSAPAPHRSAPAPRHAPAHSSGSGHHRR